MAPITISNPQNIQADVNIHPAGEQAPASRQLAADSNAPQAAQSRAASRTAEADLLEPSGAAGIQTAFARMQLVQARICKGQSHIKMEEIQKTQQKQLQIANLIRDFRGNKDQTPEEMDKAIHERMKALGLAVDPQKTSGGRTVEQGYYLDELIKYMQAAWDNITGSSRPEWGDRGTAKKWIDDWLPKLREWRATGKPFVLTDQGYENLKKAAELISNYVGDGHKGDMNSKFGSMFSAHEQKFIQNSDQWEFNLKSMTNYQEQIGTKTQSHMVALQDFIGQYNSYLQGANAALNEANRLLAKLGGAQ